MKITSKNAVTATPAIIEAPATKPFVAIPATVIQPVKSSGYIWRGGDKLAIWVITTNGFMWIFKQELEKSLAYNVGNRLAVPNAMITTTNWNRIGFAQRTDVPAQAELAI